MNADGVTLEREMKKQKILGIAMERSITYGLISFAVVGVATVIAAKRNKRFDEITSISAKASFPIMAGIGIFSFAYEMTVNEAQRYPERYGLAGADFVPEVKKVSTMPFHHKAINYCYDHPFQLISLIGFPFAGAILKQQLELKHLTVSQKIMHSRVFAQGGVLTILLSTMAFREYMDKHGRFPGDEDEQAEKK